MAVVQPIDETVAGLLEAAPDGIIAVDNRGRIVLANAQIEALFGYAREELIGQSVEMLVPEGTRAVHAAHRDRYERDRRRRPMGTGIQLAGRRRDGSEFPAEISLAAVTTRDGILVAAAIRDLSERNRGDAKFRSLLEAAPDAMLCVGADGRIALVNAEAERLLGYSRDELIGEVGRAPRARACA